MDHDERKRQQDILQILKEMKLEDAKFDSDGRVFNIDEKYHAFKKIGVNF